jgi:hypothetical protein
MQQMARIQPQGGETDANSPRARLYTLLDTLVAVRMDLSQVINGADGVDRLHDARLRKVRILLDTAIASTKDIIEVADSGPSRS